MKRFLLALTALLLLALPAPAAVDGVCNYTAGSTTTATGFANCTEEIQGLSPKLRVRAATTANITLSGAQTIDGISVVAGDRVLVKNQTTTSQNGIYVAAAGAWSRAVDADAWEELPGALVTIEVGTVNADSIYMCASNAGGTLGSTAVTWLAVTAGSPASAAEPFLTISNTSGLLDERAFADGLCIDSTDGGANSTFTIAVGTCSSANLATAVTDETGSGAAVFATSPTLVTPALGTPSSATLTNATGLPISSGVSGLGTGVATALGTPSSANLRSAVTDETGTGALMFGLTTAMSDDLSCTGSQVVRRNAGDTAFECATPAGGGDALTTNPLSQFAATTSAQLAGVISDETGSGALVFGTSPAFTTPNLGTPSAVTLTNGTGLPLSTGVTGALGIANGGLGAAFTDPNADQLMFWDDSAAAITGIVTLSGAAISGTTLTINDVTCTDCLGPTEISDLTLGTDTAGNYVSGLAAGTGISVSHTPAEGSTGTYSFDFSDAGASPSLGADECRFTSNATVGGHIVCEGDTADAFESRIAITDPTADRLLTIPNADTVTVQGVTCSGTDKVSAINATTGAVTCSADAGAAGGDSVTVNGSAMVDPDFDDATPAAAGSGVNVKWQYSAPNLSAYVQESSETQRGVIEQATTSEAETGTDTARAVTPAGLLAAHSGKHTIYVPAAAMIAETTTGCASGTTESTTNQVMYKTLDCDASTQEGAQFMVGMPKSSDEGTLTFRVDWTAASGSGDVIWLLSCLARSNDDAIDTAFGTEVSVTDTLLATGDAHQSAETSAVTPGGTWAEGDNLWCRVQRDADAAGDTIAADVKLLGVRALYSINAFTDD